LKKSRRWAALVVVGVAALVTLVGAALLLALALRVLFLLQRAPLGLPGHHLVVTATSPGQALLVGTLSAPPALKSKIQRLENQPMPAACDVEVSCLYGPLDYGLEGGVCVIRPLGIYTEGRLNFEPGEIAESLGRTRGSVEALEQTSESELGQLHGRSYRLTVIRPNGEKSELRVFVVQDRRAFPHALYVEGKPGSASLRYFLPSKARLVRLAIKDSLGVLLGLLRAAT